MSEKMGEIDNVNAIKKKLIESLGDKYKKYLRLIRNWFKMKVGREQLEADLKLFLTPHQKHLHDQLLLNLLQKSANIPSTETRRPRRYRNCDRFKDGFEPIDSTLIVVTERREVNAEIPPFLVHERLLPDQSTTLARLMYGAWEIGLEGSHPSTAEYLMLATQHFLKNIITAAISRKKGYDRSYNGFLHNLGSAAPNPWLKNVAKRKPEQFRGLRFDRVLNNGILKPAERPTPEEIENEAMFRLAASNTAPDESGPITLYDLMLTLQMYPSLISSNFVRVINTERIFSKICHPVIDD